MLEYCTYYLEYALGQSVDNKYIALVDPVYRAQGYPNSKTKLRPDSNGWITTNFIEPWARWNTWEAWQLVEALSAIVNSRDNAPTGIFCLTRVGANAFLRYSTMQRVELRFLDQWKGALTEAWRVKILHATEVPAAAEWAISNYPKDFENALSDWSAAICDVLIQRRLHLAKVAKNCTKCFGGEQRKNYLDRIYALTGKLTSEQLVFASLSTLQEYHTKRFFDEKKIEKMLRVVEYEDVLDYLLSLVPSYKTTREVLKHAIRLRLEPLVHRLQFPPLLVEALSYCTPGETAWLLEQLLPRLASFSFFLTVPIATALVEAKASKLLLDLLPSYPIT